MAAIESSFFPVPPVALLAPMVFFSPHRVWRYGAICLAGSVFGSVVGYLVGVVAFEWLGKFLLENLGYLETYNSFVLAFRDWGWWIILLKGVTPFPFQVATLFSGVVQLDFIKFLAVVAVARTVRYTIVCIALVWLSHVWNRLYGAPNPVEKRAP